VREGLWHDILISDGSTGGWSGQPSTDDGPVAPAAAAMSSAAFSLIMYVGVTMK
jgi:hypothetical protein